LTDSSSVWLHQRTETELASQMRCFNGIIESEHGPNEVQCFCHGTIDGRQRTKGPVTVHALAYSDAVITDNVHILRIWIAEANQNT